MEDETKEIELFNSTHYSKRDAKKLANMFPSSSRTMIHYVGSEYHVHVSVIATRTRYDKALQYLKGSTSKGTQCAPAGVH